MKGSVFGARCTYQSCQGMKKGKHQPAALVGCTSRGGEVCVNELCPQTHGWLISATDIAILTHEGLHD